MTSTSLSAEILLVKDPKKKFAVLPTCFCVKLMRFLKGEICMKLLSVEV